MSHEIIKEFDQEYKHGFHDERKSVYEVEKGLSENIIREISKVKNEPQWMLEFRLKSYKKFKNMEMPKWGPDLSSINFDDIIYYAKASEKVEKDWDDVPTDIKETFEKLGIPEAEAKYLSGVSTQYDSEVVYENMLTEVEEKGILFLDTDSALKKYPDIFKKYFSKLIPASDNKFAALNSAVWSGGTFIYIPKGVKLDMPLQAYFRINTQDMGQFERTLIIVDEGADVHYVEGCTAPVYSTDSLHAAVVEIFVHDNAKCRYSTIQNWSNNVLNLVTKRAKTFKNAQMEWIDGNIGSRITMKYPAVILAGDNSKATCISVAIAGDDKHIDSGAKMIHLGRNTSSRIISKSIAHAQGNATYRGIVSHGPKAFGARSDIECDTILIGKESKSDTIPFNVVKNDSSKITHEATVGNIDEDKIYYLMTRGISKEEATQILIMGFIDEFVKELPMEYAIELNRLVSLEMEGSIG